MNTINLTHKVKLLERPVAAPQPIDAYTRNTLRTSKARADLLGAIRSVLPHLAEAIEQSDAIDLHELNARAAALAHEMLSINRECDRLLRNPDETAIPAGDGAATISSTTVHFVSLEERLEEAIHRRGEISDELQKIKEQRDAPLFVRMNCVSKLIKAGFDRYAAELMLDLICSGFYGLEQLMSSESDSVEFCLRRLAALHGTAWLNKLIKSQPEEVASYKRLLAVLKESS
jgi:hypothetical protein